MSESTCPIERLRTSFGISDLRSCRESASQAAPASTAKAGFCGTAIVGDDGIATSWYGGTAVAGNRGAAIVWHNGTAVAGNRGVAIAGDGGVATTGHKGVAIAGDGGKATAGHRGTAVTGWLGMSFTGVNGTAVSGDEGLIAIRFWNGKRYEYKVGATGQGEALKAGVPYKLDGDFEFVEVVEVSDSTPPIEGDHLPEVPPPDAD